jgi:hypothetical protein
LLATQPSRFSRTIHALGELDVSQLGGYASTVGLVQIKLYLVECGQEPLERPGPSSNRVAVAKGPLTMKTDARAAASG